MPKEIDLTRMPEGTEKNNLRIVNEIVDEEYFTIDFTPGTGAYVAGGGVTPSLSTAISKSATVLFPATAGGTATWRHMVRRRNRWRRAGVRVTIRYTSDVGSANNFVFFLRFSGSGDGDVIGATADYTTTHVFPGPAVASTEMSYSFVDRSTDIIQGNRPLLHVRFVRDKTDVRDTNANALHVLLVTLEVLPA